MSLSIPPLNETKESFGGIQVRNREQINVHLFCQRCHLLLQYPTQLLCCGIRLCRWCSKTTLSNNQSFICQFCDTHLSERQVHPDRGAERELNALQLECYACSWNGSYQNYLDHLEKEHAVFECVDCHKCFVTINCVEEHRKELCEYRRVRCGLPGCDEMVGFLDVKAHYLCTKHQTLLLEFIIQYLNSRKQLSDNKYQELIIINQIMDRLFPKLETLLNDCVQLRMKHDETKTTCDQLISEMNTTAKMINDDSEKLTKQLQAEDNIFKDLVDVKKSYPFIDIILLHTDGTAIFPFSLPHNDISAAFSLISPVFKTTVFGYSFILRTFSTLDYEDDNQQYLSVSLSLLRGEYDAILTFPFPYNIFICLCDQSGQRKHIISKITPDSNSSSLIRPTNEKNPQVDLIKFCPLSYLADINSIYFRDNRFYFEIFVDFMNSGVFPSE